MQRWFRAIPILWLMILAGCGSGNNTPNNVGLFGNWNITMYPNGSGNPAYVFALAMSQEGNDYSGSSIAYTGSVAAPSNMCIDANTLSATATTSGSNFTMTVTDASSNTVISVQGSLSSQSTNLSGTYNNPASSTCPESEGTMNMAPQ